MITDTLKIGIIQGSVREWTNGDAVAKWVYDFLSKRNDAHYEIVDLADYNLPLLGSKFTGEDAEEQIKDWSEKMASFDGYIFIRPEYYNDDIGGLLEYEWI